jgi:F-type H+-transporting ATPase subunit b
MNRWLALAALVGIALLGFPAATCQAEVAAAETHAAGDSHGDDHAHDAEHGGGHHAHTIHGQPPRGLLGPGTEFLYIDPILFFWTIGVFLGTAVLLRMFAWKPILHSLEEREHKIASSLAKAEQIRAEAKQLLAEQDAELVKAHEQAKRLLDEAREKASLESEAMIVKAREDADRSQSEAEAKIAQARSEALSQIKTLAGTLSTEIASKVTDKRFNAGDFRQLVEETAT